MYIVRDSIWPRGWRTWRSWESLGCSESWGTTACLSWMKRTFGTNQIRWPIIQASLAISRMRGRARSGELLQDANHLIAFVSSQTGDFFAQLDDLPWCRPYYHWQECHEQHPQSCYDRCSWQVKPDAHISTSDYAFRPTSALLLEQVLQNILGTWLSLSWIFRRIRASSSLAKFSINPASFGLGASLQVWKSCSFQTISPTAPSVRFRIGKNTTPC